MKKESKNNQIKRNTISIWNEIAPRYHNRWASKKAGPFQSTTILASLSGIKKGDHVLDLACGTGVVSKTIASKVGSKGFVLGLDLSSKAISIAKKWNMKKKNLWFIVSDAENFHFNEKFDIITCQYALFFFPNATKSLKNIKNNLKKNGTLGLVVHGNKESVPFFTSIIKAVTQFIPDYIPSGTPALDRFSTKSSLRKTVLAAGFSKIKIKEYNFEFSPGTFEDYWSNYLRYIAKPLKEKLNTLSRFQKKDLKSLVRKNIQKFTNKNDRINFPWKVLILTAKNS